MTVPANYVFKTITAQFFGKRFALATSQELFCCNSVDAGSALLVNSLIKECSLPSVPRILDVGCGTGVLSLAMYSQYPDADILAVDRDALALAFTEMNCRENGFQITTASSLGCSAVFDRSFDLVMSNIPAKAGLPVIATMLADFSRLAGPKGTAAVVIVKTLSDFMETTIRDAHGEIVFMHTTNEYTIVHYRNMDHSGENAALGPYMRSGMEMTVAGRNLRIRTVFGLPEFDSPGFSSGLVLDILGKKPVSGSVLVANPVQGLIPVRILAEYGEGITEMHAAGRDLLSLMITEQNVLEQNGRKLLIHHCPTFHTLDGHFDTIIILYEKEVVDGARGLLLDALVPLLAPGGTLIISGTSTCMHRFESAAGRMFIKFADKKSRGFRALGLSLKD